MTKGLLFSVTESEIHIEIHVFVGQKPLFSVIKIIIRTTKTQYFTTKYSIKVRKINRCDKLRKRIDKLRERKRQIEKSTKEKRSRT